MKTNKQPSVEETAKKFNNNMAFQLTPSNDTMKAVRLAHIMVTELLQAERQAQEGAMVRMMDEVDKRVKVFSDYEDENGKGKVDWKKSIESTFKRMRMNLTPSPDIE